MKTKEGEKQVLGFRCQGAAKKSEVRCPASEITRYRSRPFSTRLSAILTPDSCLLTPYELIGKWPKPDNYRLDFHDCHPLP